MKSIELKSVKEVINVSGQPVDFNINTLDLIETCVNTPTEGGMNAKDLYSRIKILDAVREARKKKNATRFELEKEDYDNLATYVHATKWSIVSRTIAEFTQQFPNKE